MAVSEPDPYQAAVESVLKPAYAAAEQAYAAGDRDKGNHVFVLVE